MKNPRGAGAYVFSQIVASLWIAKTTLTSYQKRKDGGKSDLSIIFSTLCFKLNHRYSKGVSQSLPFITEVMYGLVKEGNISTPPFASV